MDISKEYELGYKDALCGVRFKYLKEANGEEYTKGYNAGSLEPGVVEVLYSSIR